MNEVDEWTKAGARRQRRWVIAGGIATAVAGVIAWIIVFYLGCHGIPAGDQRVIKALESQGLSNIVLGGPAPMACDGENSRHFEATNVKGTRVSGTACCGIIGAGGGCTIRWGP